VRASSTRIGTARGPSSLSRSSCVRKRTNACVVEISRPSAVGSRTALKVSSDGTLNCSSARGRPVRQIAAERLPALLQVLHLRRVVGRPIERDAFELVVGDRNVPAIAERLDVLVDELLRLVRGVLALAALAHAEALDGLDEQHRRLALVVGGAVERCVHLLRIVAAAVEPPDVLVAHLRDHLEQLRVLAEEVLADERAVVGLHRLVVAVDGLHHHAPSAPSLSRASSGSQ
jgi:hypothetical protein